MSVVIRAKDNFPVTKNMFTAFMELNLSAIRASRILFYANL